MDANVNADYRDFCVDFLGVSGEITSQPADISSCSDPPPAANNVAFDSIRQIAFEVSQTLSDYSKIALNANAELVRYDNHTQPPVESGIPINVIVTSSELAD